MSSTMNNKTKLLRKIEKNLKKGIILLNQAKKDIEKTKYWIAAGELEEIIINTEKMYNDVTETITEIED